MDPTSLPATRLAEAIAARELSAIEVVEAHLRRIEEVNPRVNAVVQVDGDRALAAGARGRRDAARRAGPLHGVPFTVKDNLEAAGIEMAIGRRGAGRHRPRPRTPPWSRGCARPARSCSARRTARTYGGGIETDNAVYGRTNNPYDLDRTPGGSSGGEAAAIAAGCSPCGLGTDSGASVRLPAHFCGLAALKPTSGRVPVTGVIDDLGQIGALGDPRTQVGVLARSAARRRAHPRASSRAPTARDGGVAARSPLRQRCRGADAADGPARRDAHRQRARHPDAARPSPPSRRRAGARGDAGALIEPASPPARRPRAHDRRLALLRRRVQRRHSTRSCAAGTPTAARCSPGSRRYDLVLCPVFPEPARRHGDMNRPGERDPTSYTTPYSLTGWPAATVRAGSSPEGLPIGVQLVAHPWRDDVALAAAAQVEHAHGGCQPPPL